jgi:hypothetical protein
MIINKSNGRLDEIKAFAKKKPAGKFQGNIFQICVHFITF